jgi:hypothetical protein
MKTLTFSEKSKGWTSFQAYEPDGICGLNSRMYTIKNGQLFVHGEPGQQQELATERNNFYGTQYPSKITTIFNESPNRDKIFKTLVLEGSHAWDALLETNLAQSTIDDQEFNLKESRWFAYVRKNEQVSDLTGTGIQGIGQVVSVAGTTVNFTHVPDMLSVGDAIVKVVNGTQTTIGTVQSKTETSITLSGSTDPADVDAGDYCFARKNARIEGSEIRGYYMEVTLENDSVNKVELFAIGTNVVLSHV